MAGRAAEKRAAGEQLRTAEAWHSIMARLSRLRRMRLVLESGAGRAAGHACRYTAAAVDGRPVERAAAQKPHA